MKKIVLLFFLFVSFSIYAWNSNGHKITAAIAYDNLTPTARAQVDQLTQILDPGYPAAARFLYISNIADQMREQGDGSTDSWHFINLPWSSDGTATKTVNPQNVVWAINHFIAILKNPTTDQKQRAQALHFLVHFVADAHQPLHCINRFSTNFPNGDFGGNDYAIKIDYANNLHSFWDQEAGLFKSSKRFKNKKIFRTAEKIMQQYPKDKFAPQLQQTSASQWIQQCYQLAINQAYQIPLNSTPTAKYVHQSQMLVKQQLALSGYRLADLLNQIVIP